MNSKGSDWPTLKRALVVAVSLFTNSAVTEAAVTRIEITRVESPTFEGRSFGDVGQYEKLIGIAYGEVDPSGPLNSLIVNLDLAKSNERDMVEYSADFYILKPLNEANGNHTMFYEVNNRGNKLLFLSPNHFFVGAGGGNDPTTAADAGDGFLMRQGYTLVWSGWLGNLLPGGDRVIARLPVATNPGGEPITHLITTDFVFSAPHLRYRSRRLIPSCIRPSSPVWTRRRFTAAPVHTMGPAKPSPETSGHLHSVMMG